MARVPRLFPNSTIVCLGGGPSLTREDVEFCRGRAKVIAINDAYQLAPWADVLYACDEKWWDVHQGVPGFTGLKFALQSRASRWPNVQVLGNSGDRGLERDPSSLKTGRNSGFQAVNLAVHLGASRIVLLGYDMQRTQGKAHWFGEHPGSLRQASPYSTFIEMFASIVPELQKLGIAIVNASRQTALTCIPRQSLADALLEVAA